MKNVLIIGASSGIGRELARQLLDTGEYTVYGTWCENRVDPDSDLMKINHLNVMDEDLNLDFLPDVLHGFVYCPGSINLRPFLRIKPEDFVADFNLQVMGAIRIIQMILPRLKKSGNASIVLFSTLAVQRGFPFHAQVSVSKGAVEGLTRALAAELTPGIRVNCIAPSLTDTPLAANLLGSDQKRQFHAEANPMKRTGKVQDHASMAGFLLSKKSGWITGQVLHVDGGASVIK
jgi:NAD(P)-dependent dehydrogenase (short-subunit alcohol dehydrogenase family)